MCGIIGRSLRVLHPVKNRPMLALTGADVARILAEREGTAEHRSDIVLQGLTIMAQYIQ